MHIKSCICVKNIDLRQNVLFSSKEAGVKIKYDECLVQGLFLHSLETRLHHEAVRTKLRPFLQQPDITDDYKTVKSSDTIMHAL